MSGDVAAAVSFAVAQVGKPYVWGATGPDAFDCSGLVYAAFRSAGFTMTRVSQTQMLQGVGVSQSDLQVGDLVFPDPGHVQIYVGGGKIVEAANSSVPIRVVPMWGFLTARRLGSGGGGAGSGAMPMPAGIAEQPVASGPAAPAGDTGAFLGRVTGTGIWIRVGYVASGFALVYYGAKIMRKS